MKKLLFCILGMFFVLNGAVFSQTVSVGNFRQDVIDPAPQKFKFKPGQFPEWNIELAGSKPQILKIKVKNVFQIGTAIKALAPFAVANTIRQNVVHPQNNQVDAPIISQKVPINISAGVVSTIGVIAKPNQRRYSQLVLKYYNPVGQVKVTDVITIRHGSEVSIPLRDNPLFDHVNVSFTSQAAVKVFAHTIENTSNQAIESNGELDSMPLEVYSTSSSQKQANSGPEPTYNSMNGDNPDGPGDGDEDPDEGESPPGSGDVFPSSLTNPSNGEFYVDSYGTVFQYDANYGAWMTPEVTVTPQTSQGQVTLMYAAPVVVMESSGFISEMATVAYQGIGGALSIIMLPILVKSDSNNPYPNIPFPDAAELPWEKGVSPGPQWVWKGNGTPESGQGNWVNDQTGQKLHPDLDHPAPKGPHWGLKQPDGTMWDIFPDGSVQPNN